MLARMPTLVLILCFTLTGVLAGCGNPPKTDLSTLEAEKKLVRLLTEEYSINAKIKFLENTCWIYLPLEESFLSLKASENGPVLAKKKRTANVIKYVSGQFDKEKNRFMIEYDIGEESSYKKDFGYSSSYSEKFQKYSRAFLRYYDLQPLGKKVALV